MSRPFDLPGVIVHRDAFDPNDDRPWTPFPEGAAYLRRRHASIVDACVRWTAARGRVVDPDVIAVLCGAAEEGFNGGLLTRWTVERMYHMLCCHLPNWCHEHHAEAPDECNKEALWLLVSFLAATERLDDDSDPPELLLQVLRCHGINAAGFESDDEADWRSEQAPFEYDGPSHGELKRRADRTSATPRAAHQTFGSIPHAP